jgi:hypothetical protein
MGTYFFFALLAGIFISSSLYSERDMSQKALLLRQLGTPLVLGSRPIPRPGMNQLLVKVTVAGRELNEPAFEESMTKTF